MDDPDARIVVLARVRAALAHDRADRVHVPRDYHHAPSMGAGDTKRFIEVLTDYRAQVLSIDPASIAATISSLIPAGGMLAVPADAPSEWTKNIQTAVDLPGTRLTTAQLDDCSAVVTGCALAISATGTIVLDAGQTQGRRVMTLIPDHHICVVFCEQVVDTVPQAFAALNPIRPLTFISGPSASSDIELKRVEGVHGPRRLDVLLVSGSPGPLSTTIHMTRSLDTAPSPSPTGLSTARAQTE